MWLPKTKYFHFEDGAVDADIRLNVSSDSPLQFSGKIVSKKINYIIRSKRKAKAYAFPEAVIDIQADWFEKVFNVSSKITIMDVSLDTSIDLDFRNSAVLFRLF